jgi:putative transposase
MFGEIENDIFISKPAGLEIARIWMNLTGRFRSIEIDEFYVMPNHFRGMVIINSLPKSTENMVVPL